MALSDSQEVTCSLRREVATLREKLAAAESRGRRSDREVTELRTAVEVIGSELANQRRRQRLLASEFNSLLQENGYLRGRGREGGATATGTGAGRWVTNVSARCDLRRSLPGHLYHVSAVTSVKTAASSAASPSVATSGTIAQRSKTCALPRLLR